MNKTDKSESGSQVTSREAAHYLVNILRRNIRLERQGKHPDVRNGFEEFYPVCPRDNQAIRTAIEFWDSWARLDASSSGNAPEEWTRKAEKIIGTLLKQSKT